MVAAAPEILSRAQFRLLREAAVTMYDALGCAGVAQVDFVLTEAGPVLARVDTAPEFTRNSPVPRMFAGVGICHADLLDLLVTDALNRGRTLVAT
jgi:D-alanine-D-alanine ligase